MGFHFAIPILALSSAVAASQDAFQSKCVQFGNQINLPHVSVNFAEYVPGGTNLSLSDNAPSCNAQNGAYQNVTADLCRITMAVETSNSSQITLEAWFPREYNGRFLSTGNGGLSGCIQYYDLDYASQFGFATVGANNGHNGTSGKPFYHHPEVLKDFAYRSLHTGVVVGKELTKQFYDEGFNKSYYLGCSTGGRQGWKSIQRYPSDFDGVVAGAPAINFSNLISWSARFYSILGSNTSDTYLTPDEWSLVHDEILRQCDTLDGAKDGIIEDPDLCRPILQTLICAADAKQTSSCLSSAQVHAAEQAFSPLYGTNGDLLYPRMQPGSEILASWIMYNGEPFPFSLDWFRYVVYDDPSWSGNFTVKDAAAALAQNPYNIQTWEGDIRPFQKTGGKILHYHGMQDELISSEDSKLYYSHVAEAMGQSPSELDDFYRFFPISGMSHCANGDGASAIGQGTQTYASSDPESNVLMAMVKWVEEGVAPETVRGAKLSAGPGSQAEYWRKHCRWPRRNFFKGPGNYTDESAWQCI
ncbi:hypothetical protein N7468_007319 [Penicillium chermesinum]|uniref:Carboxylic ester hydrolase n=1 Tax=Penicillium chermesinum TaxID=63820 RepID=A0A9W9NU00_9EURO|nr:uncharacterized protein N7468_007319 [Penicillium chermesinum]KAJ5226094.1 hypothetical protein N7468_007319 [Penicillium chermesinum]